MTTRRSWPRYYRVLPILLASLLLLAVALPSAEAADLPVKVGLYENAPKLFTDSNGEPAGIFIDIIRHIAGEAGWKLQFIPGSWNEGLARLAGGEIDLMPDVALTGDRSRLYAFHALPVLTSWFQVYAPEGSGIRTIFDLEGKRAAVLSGSVQHDSFRALSSSFGLSVTPVTAENYHEVFALVSDGSADVAVANNFFGRYHASQFQLEDTAVIFQPSDLYFAAAPQDPLSLLPVIDRQLADLKSRPDSAYYSALARWTESPVRFRLPRWIPILIAAISAVLLLSLLGSLLLRHQVALRTRELRVAYATMEQRVVDRTRELQSARERAEESDRLKSVFLATMSHELRTPLNSIIGFTGILLQGLAGPLTPEQRKQLGMIQGSARHLLALINEILDLSRIEAGQMKLDPLPFPVLEAMGAVIGQIKPQAEQKRIQLLLSSPEDPGIMISDRRRFEQILLNLLGNGVKFTERGTVALICEAGDDRLTFKVEDTGIGIPAEELKHLFKPFSQISSGLTRTHEGSGLGLSISRRLAELMGGTITIESSPGIGTKALFTVSRQSPAQPPEPGAARNLP